MIKPSDNPQNALPLSDQHACGEDTVLGHLRVRLTLQTLSRGDGLLGLMSQGKLGPRGDSVTIAQFDWTYQTQAGDRWHTPAPSSILNNRPAVVQELLRTSGRSVRMRRDLAAEADAMDHVWNMGFVPLDDASFQWRSGDSHPSKYE